MDQESSQAELVEPYRLKTCFGEDSVCHITFSPSAHAREEEWRRAQVIGRGGSGVVHLEYGPKNRVRAVKIIDKTTFPPGLDFTRELAIMSFLTKNRGSLFVQFLGWFENSESLYIAMEYFEKGDLRRHLGERMSVPTAKLLARQLLGGLSFMHESGIAHRDLKPENIFVVSLSPLRVKLGDFGVSKCINKHTMLRTLIFTRSYSAPEILGVLDSSLETSEYTCAVDIWSLGCVIFEVLTGSILFRMECFVWHFCYGKAELMLEPLREAVDVEDGFEFVRRLLSPDPLRRPGAMEALRDPWLKEPRIRKVKEAGDTLVRVVVRPQVRVRKLLLPIPARVFPHIFRSNGVPEESLALYLGSCNRGGVGGRESAVRGSNDGARWHGLLHAMLTCGRDINGELIKLPLPLTKGSKYLFVFCFKGLLALASIPPGRQKYHLDNLGGTANDVISSAFDSALGLWLMQEAFRLIFRLLLPQQRLVTAAEKGGSRFADMLIPDSLVFYFLAAPLGG
ncbi:kinase-like domain-containing protein, partial [Tuber brumale]